MKRPVCVSLVHKHSPNDLVMGQELALESCPGSDVWLNHRISVVVEPEAEGCPQDAAELLQESGSCSEQLVRRQEHHNHQHTICQIFWNCSGTVQTVPATFFVVTALITATIGIVVHAVRLIDGTVVRHKKD